MDDSPEAGSIGLHREVQRAACVECRTRKIRCLSVPQSAICQRCHGQGKECIIPLRTRRPHNRRSNQLKTRVQQLEESLESVVIKLNNNSATTAVHTGNDLSSDGSPSFEPTGTSSQGQNACPDAFDLGYVSLDQAEQLCDRYRREYQQRFPFVLLPKESSVRLLQQKRPLLLQAILVSTSWQDRTLQLFMEKRFLKDLSARAFLNEENSLDMLQSLLVYLAWYQFHMNLPGHQAYRLASLAVTMLVELGLDRKLGEPRAEQTVPQDNIDSVHLIDPKSPDIYSAEARRAIVGCYYCATNIAISYRKVNTLPYSSYVNECALSLAAEKNEPSDAYLIHHVGLLQILEEIRSTLGCDMSDSRTTVSEEKLNLYITAFESKLNDLKHKFPSSFLRPANLDAMYHVIGVYIHGTGFHNISINQSSSITRITTLFSCLSRCEAYMELVTSMSADEMRPWSFFDWRQLNYIITTISKIIVAIDPSINTNESITRVAKLDDYLKLVTARLRSSFMLSDSDESKFKAFEHLLVLWRAMRGWLQNVNEQHTMTVYEQLQSQVGIQDQLQSAVEATATQAGGLSFHGMDLGGLWADEEFWAQANVGI